jgi:hypothetical protein
MGQDFTALHSNFITSVLVIVKYFSIRLHDILVGDEQYFHYTEILFSGIRYTRT